MICGTEPIDRYREERMTFDSKRSLLLLALIALMMAAGAQAKEVYRWTDENGVVHFSDRKPAEVRDFDLSEVPDSAPATGSSPYGTAPEPDEPSAAEQRREAIAQQKQKAREVNAERDAQCAAMRDELARLEPSRRVYFTNEQGETERMDDVQRVDRVAELKRAIAANCR
jgi:hypothetical protein